MPDPAIPGAESLLLSVLELRDTLTAMPGMLEQFGGSEEEALKQSAKLMAANTDPRADRVALFNQMCDSGMIDSDIYLSFLLSERGKAAYRAFFQAVLALEDGRALLWHCTDGKDRTGCAAMLLLFALGASRETVLEDYLLTNAVNAERLDALRSQAAPHRLPPDRMEMLLFMSGGVIEGYMNRTIDALIEGYGSVEGYLAREMGLDRAGLDALRSRFLL